MAEIKRMIPLAEKLKVIIAVEEVWNKFLLSPLEFAATWTSSRVPWVRAYFDVGNVVISGYPQDWIRTLGKRIVKLHLKDFKFAEAAWRNSSRCAKARSTGRKIHKALAEIGYNGTATVELPAGDEAYLREVSHRVDLILQGA